MTQNYAIHLFCKRISTPLSNCGICLRQFISRVPLDKDMYLAGINNSLKL